MSELFWSEYVKNSVIEAAIKYLEIDKEDLSQIENDQHRKIMHILVEDIYTIIRHAATQSNSKNDFLLSCAGKFNTLIKKHLPIAKLIRDLIERALGVIGDEVGLTGYFEGNFPEDAANKIIFL